MNGLSTYFDKIGTPTGDCAIPTNDLKDSNNKELPFVALNINKAQGSKQDMQGTYNKGGTCGRWMKIKLGQNCTGGSNSQRAVCQGGSAFHAYGRSAIRLQVLLAVWRHTLSARPLLCDRVLVRGCLSVRVWHGVQR